MKLGTQNLSVSELHNMVEHPNSRANAIGKRPVYHLQYIRDGKPSIKPKEKEHGEIVSDQ